MQKGMTKLNTSLNRLTRMSGQRFKVDGLKVAPTAAPPTFNDENFEFQAPGVNNNQNDNELQVENEFGFDVGVMVVEPNTTAVLVRPQRHSLYSGRSLKWELVVESLRGYLQGLKGGV